MKQNYEQGTIKVVWVEKDPDKIYSKMFEDAVEADAFGKTKGEYIIFSLVEQENMEEFCWKILPYGKHNLYSKMVGMYMKQHGVFLKLLERMFG